MTANQSSAPSSHVVATISLRDLLQRMSLALDDLSPDETIGTNNGVGWIEIATVAEIRKAAKAAHSAIDAQLADKAVPQRLRAATIEDYRAVLKQAQDFISFLKGDEYTVAGHCIDQVLAMPNPTPSTHVSGIEDEIARVVQSVNEWDDRTSPADYPEHLLITSEELADILRNFAASVLATEGKAEEAYPDEHQEVLDAIQSHNSGEAE